MIQKHSFEVLKMVYTRNYQNVNKRLWGKGKVKEVYDCRTYIVKLNSGNFFWQRNANQIIKTVDFRFENQELGVVKKD